MRVLTWIWHTLIRALTRSPSRACPPAALPAEPPPPTPPAPKPPQSAIRKLAQKGRKTIGEIMREKDH